jgi:hypothetical protein
MDEERQGEGEAGGSGGGGDEARTTEMENGAPWDVESAGTELEIPPVTGDLRSAGHRRSALRRPDGSGSALRRQRGCRRRGRVTERDGDQMNPVNDAHGYRSWGIFHFEPSYLYKHLVMLKCRHIKTALIVTNSPPVVGYLPATFYDGPWYLYVTK